MGILNVFKDLFNPNDEYDEEEDEQSFEDFSRGSRYSGRYEENDDYDYEPSMVRQKNDSKIVSIHTTAQLQVVIAKPRSLEEASEIANSLMEKNTVMLNLEHVSKDVGNKIMLFLQGVTYAQNGQFNKVANNTYVITPFNVNIKGTEVMDELENSGIYF